MSIPIFVIKYRTALDRVLGDFQGHPRKTAFILWRAFDCQLKSIQRIACISAGNSNKMLDGILIQLDFPPAMLGNK